MFLTLSDWLNGAFNSRILLSNRVSKSFLEGFLIIEEGIKKFLSSDEVEVRFVRVVKVSSNLFIPSNFSSGWRVSVLRNGKTLMERRPVDIFDFYVCQGSVVKDHSRLSNRITAPCLIHSTAS